MIERSLNRSGYRLRYLGELNDGRSCELQVWSPNFSVTLFMSTEEAEEFVDDIRKEFFGD